MNCIECNKSTIVKNTVKKYGTVYRHRTCLNCGKEFFTYELEIREESELIACKDALLKRTSKHRRKKAV